MDNALLKNSDTGFEELAQDLDEAETLFLYNIEVMGMPVVRAAEITGVKSPFYLLKKPHMLTARQKFREAVRGDVDFSREDVLFGYKEAVDQARMLADPMAQIAGWREIAKIKGYDKVPVQIDFAGSLDNFKRQLVTLSTEKLLEIAGNNVIDAEFYRMDVEDVA